MGNNIDKFYENLNFGSEFEWLSNTLKNTRKKKYVQYRNDIIQESKSIIIKTDDYEKLKTIEKKIKKINPKLLQEQKNNPKIFLDLIVNETNDLSYIEEAKTSIAKIQNDKLKSIMNEIGKCNGDRFELDPTFDATGSLSSEWLKHDLIYKELIDLTNWNDQFEEWTKTIEEKLKNKIFSFRSSIRYSREVDRDVILPETVKTKKTYKNNKIKKIFLILFTANVLIITAIIVLLSLFISGV